nr:PREDICTED: LOW QUALITY PROTEIN: synemin [Anolis carolinensis]|eukprot:XP_008117553.1 PREDICTED: LOW QUALITY PROTEIN: synemin [Anolis carolinensis]
MLCFLQETEPGIALSRNGKEGSLVPVSARSLSAGPGSGYDLEMFSTPPKEKRKRGRCFATRRARRALPAPFGRRLRPKRQETARPEERRGPQQSPVSSSLPLFPRFPRCSAGDWDEQQELRELNPRLSLFVARVRDLEQENRLLAQELASLRGSGARRDFKEKESELSALRRAVSELKRGKDAAETERDALRRELTQLQRFSTDQRHRRLPELDALRREWDALQSDCAALEAFLEQLQREKVWLQEEAEKVRQQRARRAAPAPLLLPPASEEGSSALVLSWSCGQNWERHEAGLWALQQLLEEGPLRAKDEAQQVRTHNQQSHKQVEELHRRWQELAAMEEQLCKERLAQEEHQGAQRAHYQMIIEALEEEKQFLMMSIAEYLKDYHELLQVKASLSLEIATYRALLEGESSQWILMWDEAHGRKLPQGVRNMLYEYSNCRSDYEQRKGKRTFPAIRDVDARYKSPTTNIHSSTVYSSQTKTNRASGKTFARDAFKSQYHPSSTIKRDATVMEKRDTIAFAPSYLTSHETRRVFPPERKTTEAGRTVSFSKESTSIQKGTTSYPNRSDNVKARVNISSFPPRSLSSSSKETEYEKTVDRTHTVVNNEIKDSKPAEQGKIVLLEGGEKKEVFAKERAVSDMERLREKPAKIEGKANFERNTEKKQIAEEFAIKHNKANDTIVADKTPKDVTWQDQMRKDLSGKNVPADTEMEESHLFQRGRNVSVVTQSEEAVEIPSHLDVQMVKTNKAEHRASSEDRQKGEASVKVTREGEVSGEEGSRMDTLLTESIAESIVSDILKGFVQKPSEAGPPPATKATSFEKKEVFEAGKLKTEIKVQAALQPDLDVSEDFDLVSFLKQDAKKVLEGSKGAPSKEVVEDIINAGAKGMEGKPKRSVRVEIVEEPLGSSAEERMEFSTPFEVEEAEDTFPSMVEHPHYGYEERHSTQAERGTKEKQPSVLVSHVEEVAEGDDIVDEEKYFVSTPDDHPLGHEEDESSVYGQIHIEEESTVKYSWQDEFLQGSQTKISESPGSPETIYQLVGEEAGTFISKEEAAKEKVAHAESFVIEKEIKIPHEFQESIKSLFAEESKDPKHQLKEALEKLDDTLPESIKQELSVLTKESHGDASSLEVDIKKVENTKKGGLVTIVAEVSLSQTLEPNQITSELLSKDMADEVRFPSPTEGDFDAYRKQGFGSGDADSKNIGVHVSSAPWTVEEVSNSAKLSSHDGLQYLSNEQVIHQGPVFTSVVTESREELYPSQRSFDINRRVQQVVMSPTEIHRTEQVRYESPVSDSLEFGRSDFGTEASASVGQSVREFRHGPEEIQTTEKVIYRGPVHKTVEVSDSEGPAQAQISTDIRSSKHITLGSKQIVEETVFEDRSNQSSETLWQMKGPEDSSRTVRHIRIEPKEVHAEQVIYEGVLPGFTELSSSGDHAQVEESVTNIRIGQRETRLADQSSYEDSLHKTLESDPDSKEQMRNTNTVVHHITLSPKEFVTEQIVFTGPVSEQHLKLNEQVQIFPSEGLIKDIKLGPKEIHSIEHIVCQGSESSGISSSGEDVLEEVGSTEMSRSMRHIQLSANETPGRSIIFHGPVSETLSFSAADLSPTDGPSESSQSAEHIKIGPKETSFTFQMDVTNVAGRSPAATIVVPSKKGAEAHLLESGPKEAENERRSEVLTFDQTVQLQRMVDQRSVISDEKKIALLYLNEKEKEEDDEDDGPWF